MFIDNITQKQIRSMKRHRLSNCPFKNSCLPISYHVGSNKAGNCAGVLYKSKNFDCIRQCIFWETAEHTVEHFEHFMTPTEALDQSHSLVLAVRASLDFNSGIQTHYNNLCKDRDNGNRHPSELQ